MSIIDDLRADAIARLRVTQSPAPGTTVRIGERFSITFSVTNTDPVLTFRNVVLNVSPTNHASFADIVGRPLPQTLPPGAPPLLFKYDFIAEEAHTEPGEELVYERVALVDLKADADVTAILKGLTTKPVIGFADVLPNPPDQLDPIKPPYSGPLVGAKH